MRNNSGLLWFDVEMEWMTTNTIGRLDERKLWFDVEMEWMTTKDNKTRYSWSCGLM